MRLAAAAGVLVGGCLSGHALAQQPRLTVQAAPGEPMRIVLEGDGEPKPVINAVRYEASFEDQTPAFKTEQVATITDAEGGTLCRFALSGPAAEQAEVSALVADAPRGVRVRWTVRYSGEAKGFFPWTIGLRWEFAAAIEGARTRSTTRWVPPAGHFEWEVPGDAPYPDLECQVRRVDLAGLPPIAFVTDWYDPDWLYGNNAQRAAFMKANLPKESPSETTFSFAILQAAQGRTGDLAAIQQGHPLSLALGDRDSETICTPSHMVELPLWVANTSASPVKARLSWDVHDYYGNEAAVRTPLELQLAPGEVFERAIGLQPDRFGILFVRARLETDDWQREQWQTIGVMPDRMATATDPDSPFGLAAIIANPETYPDQFDLQTVVRRAERIGARWLRTCPFPVKAEVTPEEEQAARDKAEVLKRHGVLPHVQMGHELTTQDGWQETLRAVLGRFGWVSDHFEFGNELNPHVDPAEQREAARKYYEGSLQPFHDILREANPGARAMPHGLGGIEGSYLDGWGECGAWDLIDVLSVHPGSFPRAPEWDGKGEFWSLIPQLRTLKQALAKHGDKPYWVTEVYAPTPPGKFGLDLRTSAEYVIRTYMVCLEWGAQVVEWYQLQDGVWYAPTQKPTDVEHNFGILYSDLSPKPAYIAYGVMTSQLAGLEFLGRRDLGDPELYAYAFGRGGQPVVHVTWSYREKHELDGSWAEIAERTRRPAMPWENRWLHPARVTLPATQKVTVVDIMGNSTDVAMDGDSAGLALSGSPIFVTGLAELPAMLPPE
jgi:hypothetical protein